MKQEKIKRKQVKAMGYIVGFCSFYLIIGIIIYAIING